MLKTGAGTLILADANTYQGGTIIEEGVLAHAADDRLGSVTRGVYLDGGTLRAMATFNTTRNMYLSPNGGGISVDAGQTYTVAGWVTDQTPDFPYNRAARALNNAGTLHKLGAGTLVFTNTANNYGGDTVIEEGRLVAQGSITTLGANDSGKSIATVNNNGVLSQLEIALDATETLQQLLIGDGEVIKSGRGVLNLVNDTPAFLGRLTVSTGEVRLTADYSAATSFQVLNGGVLSGSGVIGSSQFGIIREGGTLAPRNLVANNPDVNPTASALTVDGNLTFASGSTYQVSITQYPDATYYPADPDRMRPVSDWSAVKNNGVVTIEGGAKLDVIIDYWSGNLHPSDFNETLSGRWTIIDATDGSAYDTSTLFNLGSLSLPRGIELQQGWNGNLYQLWLMGYVINYCPDVPKTHNEIEVCRELGELASNRDPGMVDLEIILSQSEITDEMLLDIYDQLAGDIRANAIAMAFKQPWRHPFARLNSDIYQLIDGAERAQTTRYGINSWIEVYGNHTNVAGDGNSYRHTVKRVGTVLGFDKETSDDIFLGLAFNYSQPKLEQRTGEVKLKDFELGLYSLARLGGFDLKGYLGYAFQRYDITRNVHIPAGGRFDAVNENFHDKPDGNALSLSAELSYPVKITENLKLAPLAGLDYEHVWMDGYRETGGMTALKFKNDDMYRLTGRVGLQAEYSLDYVALGGKLQYIRQLNNDWAHSHARFSNATTSTHGMDIWGVKHGLDYLNAEAGAALFLDEEKTMSLYINYNFDISKRETTHSGNLGLTFSF